MRKRNERVRSAIKQNTSEKKISDSKPVPIIFLLIPLTYVLAVTFTPNMMALDTNAPKFLALAIVNLFAFILILGNKHIRKSESAFKGLMSTNLAIVYAGFLIVAVLSFTQAINIKESLLQFSKLFSVFTATIIFALIFAVEGRLIKMLVILMAGLLIFDAFSVLYYIYQFIQGEIGNITEIKTIYSNKNILASSIYVKLPFAVYLLIFEKDWLKKLGWIALASGILTTFFMATRAFYLGLLLLTIIFIAYSLYYYLKEKDKQHLFILALYLIAVGFAYISFQLTQSYLYPKNKGNRYTQSIGKQMATIVSDKEEDKSKGLRLKAWEWSYELIKESPVLGVGVGNWKIAILKHENQDNKTYTYLYKAHNDFIENTAETGIPGGLLFLLIFVFSVLNFINFARSDTASKDLLFQSFFLSAAGISFYAVDAFFNFPADRPEILILFSVYISAGIASRYHHQTNSTNTEDEKTAVKETLFNRPLFKKTSIGLLGLLLFFITFLFYLNFESSKVQRIAFQDINFANLSKTSAIFEKRIFEIPDLSAWGEPLNTVLARYLIKEDQNEKVVNILRETNSSPFDGRKELYMARAFKNLNMTDSALHYAEKAYQLKPYYFRNTHLLMTLMEEKDRAEDVPEIFENYLAKDDREVNAWIYASGFYALRGDFDKAYELIQQGKNVFPKDSLILKQFVYINFKKFIEPNQSFFNETVALYHKGEYINALKGFEQYTDKVPADANGFRFRAFTKYYLKDYQGVIEDVKFSLSTFGIDGSLLNLRGVCYRNIADNTNACEDFKKAMQIGNAEGKSNFERFCKE